MGDKNPDAMGACEELLYVDESEQTLEFSAKIYCQSYSSSMKNARDCFIMALPMKMTKHFQNADNDGLVSVYMYGVKKEANRELIELLTRGNRGESIIHMGDRKFAGSALEPLATAFRDPVLTDMRIMFAAGSMAETYPKLLKNLYKGGNVVLRGRCPARIKELVFTLQGLSGSKAFESLYRLDFGSAAPASADLPAEWRSDRIVAGRLLK